MEWAWKVHGLVQSVHDRTVFLLVQSVRRTSVQYMGVGNFCNFCNFYRASTVFLLFYLFSIECVLLLQWAVLLFGVQASVDGTRCWYMVYRCSYIGLVGGTFLLSACFCCGVLCAARWYLIVGGTPTCKLLFFCWGYTCCPCCLPAVGWCCCCWCCFCCTKFLPFAVYDNFIVHWCCPVYLCDGDGYLLIFAVEPCLFIFACRYSRVHDVLLWSMGIFLFAICWCFC